MKTFENLLEMRSDNAFHWCSYSVYSITSLSLTKEYIFSKTSGGLSGYNVFKIFKILFYSYIRTTENSNTYVAYLVIKI